MDLGFSLAFHCCASWSNGAGGHPWTSVDPIERTGASTNYFWEMIGECRKQLSLEAVVQVGVRALEPCDSGDRATGWDHSLDHSGCVW